MSIKNVIPSSEIGVKAPLSEIVATRAGKLGDIYLRDTEDPEGAVAKVYWTNDSDEWAGLFIAAPDLLKAIEGLMCWKMRDGSPCCCPAGRDEWEPKGKMPTEHSTACMMAREAIAKATIGAE